MSDWQPLETDPTRASALSAAETAPVARLAFDQERYRDDVKDLDLSEAMKSELLATLWGIMATFVDLGFGVDPVQQVLGPFTEAARDSAQEPDPAACSEEGSSEMKEAE